MPACDDTDPRDVMYVAQEAVNPPFWAHAYQAYSCKNIEPVSTDFSTRGRPGILSVMPRRTRATALYRPRLFHGDAQGGSCTLGGGRGVRGGGRRGNAHGRAAGTFARQPKKLPRRHSLTQPQTPQTMEDPRLEGWGI